MVLQKEADRHYSFCFFSSITSESVTPLIEYINNMEQNSVLDLYINSKGGFVLVAIGIFNFIKSIKGLRVNTYNIGHCDSAATLLFLLGNKRFVSKNASFYMHSLEVSFSQPQTLTSLNAESKKLKEETDAFITLLSDNSDIAKKQWNLWMNDKGTVIKAKKAVSLGIANYFLKKEEGV